LHKFSAVNPGSSSDTNEKPVSDVVLRPSYTQILLLYRDKQ